MTNELKGRQVRQSSCMNVYLYCRERTARAQEYDASSSRPFQFAPSLQARTPTAQASKKETVKLDSIMRYYSSNEYSRQPRTAWCGSPRWFGSAQWCPPWCCTAALPREEPPVRLVYCKNKNFIGLLTANYINFVRCSEPTLTTLRAPVGCAWTGPVGWL